MLEILMLLSNAAAIVWALVERGMKRHYQKLVEYVINA